MSLTKTCTKCGEVKVLDDFRRKGNGTSSHCRMCLNAYNKAYRNENYQKCKEYKKTYRNTHREHIKEQGIEYKRANRKRTNANQAAWAKANPEKIKEINRKQYYELRPSVVSRILGISVAACPPELISLKREQLQIHRITKQLNQAIKDIQK